jgi:serine/threonine-protein kinase
MGVVYEAVHDDLGRRVAIKVIRSALSRDSSVVARMTREARAAAQLVNDHVVRILDTGQLDSGSPFIVMEYLEGRDLYSLLEEQGPLGVESAARYVLEACLGLAEAHKHGIVHRDLKPENLFLATRPDGTELVKVLDFGISKQVGTRASMRLTGPAAALGSPQYMAPEQMRAEPDVDERADVWALGAVLFELVTGKVAFEGSTVAEMCTRVLEGEPTLPRQLRGELPAALDDVVRRCLQKDRSQRFQNVLELSAALSPMAGPGAQSLLDRIARLSTPARGVSRSPVRAHDFGADSLASTVLARAPRGTARATRVALGVVALGLLVAAGFLSRPWSLFGDAGAAPPSAPVDLARAPETRASALAAAVAPSRSDASAPARDAAPRAPSPKPALAPSLSRRAMAPRREGERVGPSPAPSPEPAPRRDSPANAFDPDSFGGRQ